jgi:hypothetical protein
MHCEYAVRAARAGKHVLVEKPMAVTEDECERMMRAARDAGVKLMVAYRLHFERANLEAGEVARSGRIGEPRLFNSTFCTPVVPGNIRVRKDVGGGVLYDIGIYLHQRGARPVRRRAARGARRLRRHAGRGRGVGQPLRCTSPTSASRRSPRASARPRCPSTGSPAPRATSRSSRPTTTRARCATA